jgi:molecular chaperone GrpE (heat shock protein)
MTMAGERPDGSTFDDGSSLLDEARRQASELEAERDTERQRHHELASGVIDAMTAFDRVALRLQAHLDRLPASTAAEVRALGNAREMAGRVLRGQGFEPMPDQVGERFSPERHVCVQRQPDPDVRYEIVVEERAPGYLLSGCVFRKAQVVLEVPRS